MTCCRASVRFLLCKLYSELVLSAHGRVMPAE